MWHLKMIRFESVVYLYIGLCKLTCGQYGYGYGYDYGYNYGSPFLQLQMPQDYSNYAGDNDWNNYQYYTPSGYGDQQQPGTGSTGGATGGSGSCTTHAECTGPSVCLGGQCQQMEPTQTRCSSDAECPGGACKARYCWVPPGTPDTGPAGGAGGDGGGGQPPSGLSGPCSTQDDCGPTQMCSTGRCSDGFSTEVKCTSDGDCKDSVCKGGTCWKEGAPGSGKDGDPCESHDECSVKSICVKDKCEPGLPTTDKCVMDLMCKGGKCKYFICWKTLGLAGSLLG